MNDNSDIFDSVGGSLLNDLLSDLNAAVDANNQKQDNNNNNDINNINFNLDDGGDDLFALLEQELTSSYNAPLPSNEPSSNSSGMPPGLLGMVGGGGGQQQQQRSAAAFVVNQQQVNDPLAFANNMGGGGAGSTSATANSNTIGGGGGGDDAWSSALSTFGNMSLAADFLAADTLNKKTTDAPPGMLGGEPSSSDATAGAGGGGILPPEKLFEGEDYAVDEEVKLEETGGLAALLGASTARASSAAAKDKEGGKRPAERANVVADQPSEVEKPHSEPAPPTTEAPPPHGPGPMGGQMPPMPGMAPGQFPPHMMMHGMPPQGMPMPGMMHQGMMPPGPGMMPPGMAPGMMPPNMMPPHPNAMMPTNMMMPPPGAMNPGMMPQGMMPPPPHHMMFNQQSMMPPPPQQGMMGPPPLPPPQVKEEKEQQLSKRDFPALGETPPKEEEVTEEEEKTQEVEEPAVAVLPPAAASPPEEAPRFYFNNTNPNAPPVSANTVSTKHMPPRDITFILNMMLRPLQSLDAYNDDYYHFSMMQKRHARGRSANPVFKDVKVVAQKEEEKYLAAIKVNAKKFAEDKKSLGQMVRTNVKRPKALLTTPVLHKETVTGDDNDSSPDANGGGGGVKDSKYESEQRRNRISLWKARVSVDRGYSAFLSLIELRRLIQANVGAPQLISELMVDVKTNVDKLHSSLGVSIKVGENNKKSIEIDEGRLGSALTLPKGRTLCARVIEDGILPHPSACHILPVALRCILTSTPAAADSDKKSEGEDRLLHALTGLVRTPQPSVDPAILLKCLEELSTLSGGKYEASSITGGRMRMELVHSILSVGKGVCGNIAPLKEGWDGKEKVFMQILAGAKQ